MCEHCPYRMAAVERTGILWELRLNMIVIIMKVKKLVVIPAVISLLSSESLLLSVFVHN